MHWLCGVLCVHFRLVMPQRHKEAVVLNAMPELSVYTTLLTAVVYLTACSGHVLWLTAY